ncbi:MAG: hypothetical protein ABI193_21050 [Minicystis sp.]
MIDPVRASHVSGAPMPRALPAQAILAWAGLGALTVVIVLAVLLRSAHAIDTLEEGANGEAIAEAPAPSAAASASASAVEPALPALVPPAELDASKRGGIAPLEALAQKYPRDPAVLEALLLALAVERPRFPAAVETAKQLFTLSPESAADDPVRRVFVRLASGPNEIVEAVFDLLDTAPGSAGPDLLFEIANTDSPVAKPVKDRAQKLLEGAAMKERASPALLVALDLKAASPCARKAFFARAGESGDARALPWLKPLVFTGGCKRFFSTYDCYACLGKRGELNAAIAAIEERSPERR